MPRLRRYTVKHHHTGVLIKQSPTGEYVKYADVVELIEENERMLDRIIKLQRPPKK